MVEIHHVGNRSVNLYLLVSDTHRLLIDTGFPNSLYELGRTMRKTGFKINQIDAVLVTHFHVDHAGAVQELKNEGAQFLLLDFQQEFIQPMEIMMKGKWPHTPLELAGNRIISIAQSREVLNSFGINGQILHTPGHSEDSISLLLDSGEVFIGDLLPEHLLLEETSQSRKSWQRLRASSARQVFPGHGDSFLI